MILRKPYAFLIQYFQRIHLILVGLSFYIFYKTSTLRAFVSEFIRTESYNTDLESIKGYVSFLPIFVILTCLVVFLILMVLLRHKKKPWKTYLLPFFDYIFLLIVMLYIRNFFMTYNDISDITKIMAGRDLLFIAYLPQFAVILVLIIRVIVIIVGYTYYYFGILHKVYKEGETFQSNFYQVTVKDSYITNRKDNGDIIDKNYSYVIVRLVVKNLASKRDMYVDRFHLVNKNKEGERTPQYQPYFSTYGKVYDDSIFANNETKEFNLIYRVDKDWKNNKYILYYQGLDNSFLLRKVRLKVKDYQKITKCETKSVNQEMNIGKKDVTITNYQVVDRANYYIYKCETAGCFVMQDSVALEHNSILQIDYISDYFDSKTFVDFSTKYAKIKYEDNNGKVGSIDCVDAIGKDYTSNSLYLKVSSTLKEAKKIDLIYTIDGKKYTYQLKK